MNRKAAEISSARDAREKARRVLPHVLFDYIDGGAYDETTVGDNRAAYADVVFRPRAAAFTDAPSIERTVLGRRLSMPLILAPCGGVRLISRDGDRSIARAAADAETAFVMSTASATVLEDVAASAARGPLWFQLYFQGGRRGAELLIERVQRAGFGALFVTIDVDPHGASNHERLFPHRKAFPLRANVHSAIHFAPDLLLHPRWTVGFIRDGLPTAYASDPEVPADEQDTIASSGAALSSGKPRSSPQWSDIEWIRRAWSGPLVLKGVLSGDDARRARDLGADGIVVSNHGGRQLDYSPAPLRVLGEVRAAVGRDVEVLIDGGIMRGGDVVKALALGADAVMIGRAYLYALAVAGQAGVRRLLGLFGEEIARTLRHLACAGLDDLERSMVEVLPRSHAWHEAKL